MRVLQKTGLQFFPKHQMEQIVSLHVCFLSSVCLAVAPATTPASDKMFDLSGEVHDGHINGCRLITIGPAWDEYICWSS
jgi:hypothetical protein